ncbi:SDR family NAD(P)-dependent oxidoreductase [Hymenobacter bucti]|uniref:SDR family NAD(P)-dependent oxidoreductase n=1 Tax=Hymenobacter bucti TaxID=1844114 RepID=A0ABW4QZI2_9BACT
MTGASKGLGLALVTELLAKGYRVAATSRDPAALARAVPAADAAHFLPLAVDLTQDTSVAASFKEVHQTFGRLDVVVNNAGYGTGGALEKLSSAEIQASFDANFFAVIRVIQQALPYLRCQRSGHILNISSIAGFAPGVGWSVYAAAKFAVTGLSEALAPFNIHVSAVSPSWFRTNFVKSDSIAFAQQPSDDYPKIRAAHARFNQLDGKQLGNPSKVAAALLVLVTNRNPPKNLFLGSDAWMRATAKIEQLAEQTAQWQAVSASTDFAADAEA